ncbi:MAG: macro domain-containing protein [Eubacteriaceae bacterium]|nr:macro domain-containing protein [Eubacteriaceae bacterium]
MTLQIVNDNICNMKVDAIVNAANSSLKMGGGVCGAIFSSAGADKLQKECDSIGGCNTGDAVITSGYNLYAKYIIHTAGPIWRGGSSGEEELLRSCYINSLNLALKNNCKSIAFPLISSGIYGYPKEEAIKVAVNAISEFLSANDMDVYLVFFSDYDYKLGLKTIGDI